MGLAKEMVSQGTWLFRYRGQIPVVLFLLAVPVVLTGCGMPPMWVFWVAVAVSVCGALMRAYVVGTTPRGTSGRNTKEQVAEVLNSTGAYSLVRHPLYVANYLMWIGIVIFTGSIWFTAVVTLLYWIYYERIMATEENFLIGKFGAAYDAWADNIPAFIPKLTGFVAASERFSLKPVLIREYSGWLATVLGFVFVTYLHDVVAHNFQPAEAWSQGHQQAWWVLGITAVVTLALRTYKKVTKA
ncbi:MAG: methyltransferase family protein [Bacteroidota bacterium]